MTRFAAVLLALVLSIQATDLSACIMWQRQDFRDVLSADLVVEGSVETYEIVRGDHSLGQHARIGFAVDRVFHGRAEDRIVFLWFNSTFGLPENLDQEIPVVVALWTYETLGSQSHWPLPPRLDLDTLIVVQKPCSAPFMFDARDREGRALRGIFNGFGQRHIEAAVAALFLGRDFP
ncbi:hypothetical protein AADZ90_005830 [Aestuariibius sp. 2305UL40-4]|uniref:hypothetical protein n=1 Tax=Aestuariibius violaceus TaxID=3234132 RepID=UPI00345EB54A